MPVPTAPESKRRALGRGLEALLPSRPQTPAPNAPIPAKGGQPLEIDVTHIERNPFQTRTRFDEDCAE